MVKPIVITADAGANAVLGGDFVQPDGAGFVEASDGTAVIGRAETTKDSENNVGVIKQGLIRVGTTNATYEFGDQVEWVAGQKVVAFGAGSLVGTAAETKTTTTADNSLLVYMNLP